MNYLEWNNLIASHFFRPERAGRSVHLYVTEEIITELGQNYGAALPDFIKAVKTGFIAVQGKGICEKALQSMDYWKERQKQEGYPPYIGYLALFVLAAGIEGDFADNAYYPRLWTLLGEKPTSGYPDFDQMRRLWDDLARWANEYKSGEVGIFNINTSGRLIHVDIPRSQTLLTEKERGKLPSIFAAAELDPTAPPSEEAIASLLVKHGSRSLQNRTLKLLQKTSNANELHQALLERIIDELRGWDGTAELSSSDGSQIYLFLRLCCKLDKIAGCATFTLRCTTKHEFPEDDLLLCLDDSQFFSCKEHGEGWSSPLISESDGKPLVASKFDWLKGLQVRSPDSKWCFKMPSYPIRVFIEGKDQGLPGVLVEVRQLPTQQPFYLAAYEKCWQLLEKWGKAECKDFETLQITHGLPSRWRFFKATVAYSDILIKQEYPFLAFPTTVRLELRGIRLDRGNKFFKFAPPKVVLQGGDESIKVYCNDRLLDSTDVAGIYELPTESTLDKQLHIEARRGEEKRHCSLSWVEEFLAGNRSITQKLDSFGNCTNNLVGVAGSMLRGENPPPFDFNFLVSIPIVGEEQEILWIGSEPGQIVKLKGAYPIWSPVWIIRLGSRYQAKFCGQNLDESKPKQSTCTEPLKLREWEKVLWKERKRILLVDRDPHIRALWEEYKKRAKSLKRTKTAQHRPQALLFQTTGFSRTVVASEGSDNLLYVISAKNEMSWESFKKDLHALYIHQSGNIAPEQEEIKSIKTLRNPIVRALSSLGHCDFDLSAENRKRVYIAPSALVRLPSAGFPQAILAGARSPNTIQQLSDACHSVGTHINLEIKEQPSELILIPKRVAVQAEDVRELEAMASSLSIPFLETPSAWSLLHFAASIDDYLATLKWSNDPELNWKKETFEPNSLQFKTIEETDTNIRLSRYSHRSRNTKICYFWREGSCTEIDLDWGRYAVLQALRRNVLIYDKRRFTMAVPARANLPRLLERALTLCSGYAAKFEKKLPSCFPEIQGFNLFYDIPPPIAEMTAAKLGQTLLQQFLNITQ